MRQNSLKKCGGRKEENQFVEKRKFSVICTALRTEGWSNTILYKSIQMSV